MQHVAIPDPLYAEAQRAAEAHGVSFERFVSEAIRLHIYDDLDEPGALELTDEQASMVRRTQLKVREGRYLSLSGAEERQTAARTAWLKANQP